MEGVPMTDYLSASELCARSGLSQLQLEALEDVGLLLPTYLRPEPSYRPKLAVWGCKLAYLLNSGWTLDELKLWSRARWNTANPRQWPPPRPLEYPKEAK